MTDDDPEHLLATYPWRFDPDTLREVLDEADTALFHRIRAGLTAKLETARDDASRARLLSLRASVGQWRREFAAADLLFAAALAADLPDRSRAAMHQHAGKCRFDEGRNVEAREHFERALDLRRDGDPDLRASTELALAGVLRRVGR